MLNQSASVITANRALSVAKRLIRCQCKLVLLFALMAAPAAQATSQDGTLEARYQAAFDTMMGDPTSPERAFEFAQIAVDAGDLRGAISALERILLLKPDLANIQLELGVLYLRVGAPELAQGYLSQAIQATDIPPEIRNRAQELLVQSRAEVSRHLLTGTLFLGARHATNANAGTGTIRILGQDQAAQERATGQADDAAIAIAEFQHRYALDSQIGNTLETNGLVYGSRYSKSKDINLSNVQLDFGPRFLLGALDSPDLSIRPFAAVSYLTLGGEKYLRKFGGGIDARKFFSTTLFGDVTIEGFDQKFFDSADRPVASDKSGSLWSARANLNYQVTPTTRITGRAGVTHRDSREDFESFGEKGGSVEVSHVYAPPFGLTRLPWSSSVSAEYVRTAYDSPDPLIDPDTRRKDTRRDLVLSTNIRVTGSITVVLSLLRTLNDSTLPNFRYDNTSVSLGLAYRF